MKQLRSSEKGRVTQALVRNVIAAGRRSQRGMHPVSGRPPLASAGQRVKGPANLEIQTFLVCLLIFKYGQVIQSFKNHCVRLHWKIHMDRGTRLRGGAGGRGEGLSSGLSTFPCVIHKDGTCATYTCPL